MPCVAFPECAYQVLLHKQKDMSRVFFLQGLSVKFFIRILKKINKINNFAETHYLLSPQTDN